MLNKIIIIIFFSFFITLVVNASGIANLKSNLASSAHNAGLSKTGRFDTEIKKTASQSIGQIISYILGIIGTLAVVYAIYGGVIWITAGGNDSKVQEARKIIINAVVGVIVVSMAYLIVALAISFAG